MIKIKNEELRMSISNDANAKSVGSRSPKCLFCANHSTLLFIVFCTATYCTALYGFASLRSRSTFGDVLPDWLDQESLCRVILIETIPPTDQFLL